MIVAVEAPAQPTPIPPEIRAMIDSAIAADDDVAVDKMIDYAAKARPDLAPALATLRVEQQRARADRAAAKQQAEQARLAEAPWYAEWHGQLEFGATLATGPVNSLGLITSADLERRGINWTHKLFLRAEVQSAAGARTAERMTALWQPRYTLSKRAYAFGLAQFERDPTLGYDERYTTGVGGGLKLVAAERLRLAVEGGPALRRTVTPTDDSARIAARGTLDLGWQLSPRLEFGQRVALFYEAGSSSGVLNSTLDSKLSDKLALRVSFEYRAEDDRLRGVSTNGSVSRASLVYKL
ncbi:MAG: hypothetical protein A4S16_09440 [Proteobacteria bacterium SG_bin6]|nr:MAG: hypothetical protein A4S16_09440 [Proteobacteria bacterium SG_bin6]